MAFTTYFHYCSLIHIWPNGSYRFILGNNLVQVWANQTKMGLCHLIQTMLKRILKNLLWGPLTAGVWTPQFSRARQIQRAKASSRAHFIPSDTPLFCPLQLWGKSRSDSGGDWWVTRRIKRVGERAETCFSNIVTSYCAGMKDSKRLKNKSQHQVDPLAFRG